MAIATINPGTGETIKKFDPLSASELELKLRNAADAFHSFRRTSFADRAGWMIKAAEILESEKESLGRLMTLEMGKPIQAACDEAAKCAWACRYYAFTAVDTASSRSALGITTNGSLPPSSSTTFLILLAAETPT